jgi:hypothetical protein
MTEVKGYRPVLALRHLWQGAVAPRASMQEALAAGTGEGARLLVFALYVLCLALIDPETRALGHAAIENVFDDSSRLQGLLLLGLGGAIIGFALLLGYWAAAFAATLLAGQPLARLPTTRSAVALGAWFSLLPTVAVKLLALALMPAAMVTADPPSLFSTIEAVMAVPYLAACLAAAFALGTPRALFAAFLVNGAFYSLVVILYLVAPSQ